MGEHSGFGDYHPIIPSGMRDFQDLVQNIYVADLGYHGSDYTWCNKRNNGLICKNVDRVLANGDWLNVFPRPYSVFKAGGCSDHSRVRIIMEVDVGFRRKLFKFVNAIANFPQFREIVGEFWSAKTHLFESTSATYRFTKKIKDLKPAMRKLGKEKTGDLSKHTREAQRKLCLCQEQTLSNPCETNVEAELEAFNHWRR